MSHLTDLRKAEDGDLPKSRAAGLADAVTDLQNALEQLADALTDWNDADDAESRRDAKEQVATEADAVLAELAGFGLIAPRMGNGSKTGAELALDRLTKVASEAYRKGIAAEKSQEPSTVMRDTVAAVLRDAGYLPEER